MNLDEVMDKVLADSSGETLEDYRAKKELRTKISRQASQYINTDSSLWPLITFNWDLYKESQRFSLDGEKETDFKLYYPEGFLLGMVELLVFDRKLCYFSRRNKGELWKVGRVSSLAYLIVYLSERRPISPPLVEPYGVDKVMLQGGHHRYAIAKELKEKFIPIYIEPRHKKKIDQIIDVDWQNLIGLTKEWRPSRILCNCRLD